MKALLPTFAALCPLNASAFGAPDFVRDVVYKPTFLKGYDSFTGGTGFVVTVEGTSLFVTAHHLLKSASGLERDLSPAEACDFAKALAASSMIDPAHVITSSDMLMIASAMECHGIVTVSPP
jgi:hypothetical protein